MRSVILITVLFMSINSWGDRKPQDVNFHLRKMQTVMEAKDSNARVNAIKVDQSQIESQEAYLHNQPGFGLGDEHQQKPAFDEPVQTWSNNMTAEEKIRLELEQRQMTHTQDAQSEYQEAYTTQKERQQFIKKFKENAAAKGVTLEVDPVTLDVRKAYSP